jgi:hypothetical protein
VSVEHGVDARDLVRVEREVGGLRVLVETFDLARARDRHDVVALGEQPGERELRGRATA